MKLVTLSGGIGNQMFQYAFYLKMRSIDPHTYIHLKKIENFMSNMAPGIRRLLFRTIKKINWVI